MSSNTIIEREYLYRLIIGQLLYDGLNIPASFIGNCVGIEINQVPPSPQLLYATRKYKQSANKNENKCINNFNDEEIEYYLRDTLKRTTVLDFDCEFENVTSPSLLEYTSQYIASHKGPVTCSTFSYDGHLLATGSQDNSIKIIETEKIILRSSESKFDKNNKLINCEEISSKNHPVIKTLYDHTSAISCLEFHPSGNILASGSFDKNINLFDFTKSTIKKAFKTISEIECINSISFHPNGDYLLVAIQHPIIRLYDLNTLNCYTTSNSFDCHTNYVNSIKYDSTGKMYVSSSDDGSFKLWDSVSNKCINTFNRCHDGFQVISACFSSSGNYILSSSVDTVCRLWDIRNGIVLQSYHNCTNINPGRSPALFNQNDDYVIYLDNNSSMGCWNSRTGDKICSLPVEYNSLIRWISHSPCEPALVSCCEDMKIRFNHFGN